MIRLTYSAFGLEKLGINAKILKGNWFKNSSSYLALNVVST